jgi:hypothetical protein
VNADEAAQYQEEADYIPSDCWEDTNLDEDNAN